MCISWYLIWKKIILKSFGSILVARWAASDTLKSNRSCNIRLGRPVYFCEFVFYSNSKYHHKTPHILDSTASL